MRGICIALAKRLAKYHQLDGCIVIGVKDGEFKIVSYGVTAGFCRLLGRVAEKAGDLVEAVGDDLLEAAEPDR